MLRLKKAAALLLTIIFIFTFFQGLVVFSATLPVNLYVDSYDNGTLNFYWDAVPGVQSATITWHAPDDSDNAVANTVTLNQSTNTASISGLKADYIYDIHLKLYSQADANGETVGEGLLYYLPKITFLSSVVVPSPAYTDITGGGRESGDKPEIRLRWIEPKVYNGVKFMFVTHNAAQVYTNSHLSYMESCLASVYNDGRRLDFLNYRVNISSNLTKLNGGSNQAAIIINDGGAGTPIANVSTNDPTPDVTCRVNGIDANGYFDFNLTGRNESQLHAPDANPNDSRLPDDDILPGAVYYMNIKPIFADGENNPVNAVSSGKPEDQNGSKLTGTVQYAYTPVRFQLSKDNANNIYIKIYKINQGSLDLPRLFYQVQASDDPSVPGDWTVKKTLDDSYFSGEFAVTAISGVNPNNNVYYKIVVKSDSPNDRLESLKMPYMLSIDTSKPPVPLSIATSDRALNSGIVTNPQNQQVPVKSTDITISWDKPANWDTVKNDLVFQFLLSTAQNDLAMEVPLYVDSTYWDSYIPKYRKIKYIDALSSNIEERGNRLTYRLKGFDLFKGELVNRGTSQLETFNIANADGYPSFLVPNTVYYLKMYTTKLANAGTLNASEMSDQSLVVSFTTLNGIEQEVPLPQNFSLEANGRLTNVTPPLNYIEVIFNKIGNIDWHNYVNKYDEANYSYNLYYDIYMNSVNSLINPAFTLIGTTENQNVDIVFTGADDPASTSIKARISQFSALNVVTRFGSKLQPNTIYYFMAVTRLVVQSKSNPQDRTEKVSIPTVILPVTTMVLDVNPPDDNERRPLTPVDFDISVDSSGNRMLSGNSVTFSWLRREDDVVYEMVRTGQRVAATDLLPVYETDPEYVSFLAAYDTPSDGLKNSKVYLNPGPNANPAPGPQGKFTFDPVTRICKYTVDQRLFPNKKYYFSLKAVRLNQQKQVAAESVWTCIPVTTSLIEAPTELIVEANSQLGFFWVDSTPGITPDDFSIYIKEPGDITYKLVMRSGSTIVRDRDGKTFFARIMNLKANTFYDIRVFKGTKNSTLVYEKSSVPTRDSYHELEISWRGIPADDYSTYEIAIRAEGDAEYTTLMDSDLYSFTNKDGRKLPFYIDEGASTTSNDYMYFHARIKSSYVSLPGGILSQQPLKSNIKFYIKVRAVRVDPASGAVSYSKYAGPVSSRTEFRQEDYDNTDRENENKAVFMEKIKQLEKSYFWRVDINNGSVLTLLLKGDRVANAIINTKQKSFTIDLSDISIDMQKDVLYLPLSVIKAMNSRKVSLVLKSRGTEYVLKPGSVDPSGSKQLKELLSKPAVKDVYLKLSVSRATDPGISIPSGNEKISDVNDLKIQALGASSSDSDIRKMVNDKLYNKNSGIVGTKLNMLLNAYVGSGPSAAKTVEAYTSKLVELIEKEMSEFIITTLDAVKLNSAVQNITNFAVPVAAKIMFEKKEGLKLPYVLYDGKSSWQKLSQNVLAAGASITFSVTGTGRFMVLLSQSGLKDVPVDHWASGAIGKLTSKYYLGDVFQNIDSGFMPENKATAKEVILLFEKVTGREKINSGLDIKQKSGKMGLSSIINPASILKNIKRQDTAAVLIKLFTVKKGLSDAGLVTGKTIVLSDEGKVSDNRYKQVLLVVDLNIMGLDSEGRFRPGDFTTRAELAYAFVKVLELTGDLQVQ